MSENDGPVINGKTAEVAVKGAVALLALLIVAITVVVIRGAEIPQVFVSLASLLTGFIVGTRVIPPAVSRAIRRKPPNEG